MKKTQAFSLSIFNPPILFAVYLSKEAANTRYRTGDIANRPITIEDCVIIHKENEPLTDGMRLFANAEEFQCNHTWYTSENLAKEDHGLMPESDIIDDCTLYL